jgi:hypothetical protein
MLKNIFMRGVGALKEEIKPFLCYPSTICTIKAIKHITKLRADVDIKNEADKCKIETIN